MFHFFQQKWHSSGLIVCIIICFFSYLEAEAQSQVIPSSLVEDWSNAGYPSEIPHFPETVNVLDFGAIADGVADDRQAILDAINSLGGSRGVVYLPPGDYRIANTISLPDSTVIRGAGESQTRILWDQATSGSYGFNIGANPSTAFEDVVSGYTRGSQSLELNSASSFAIGDYAELIQDNGSWDANPATWASTAVGQILKICNISGNAIEFEEAIRIDYDPSLNPRIRPIYPKHEIGIECLYMERLSDPDGGAGYNIAIRYAANCWVKGIHSNKSVASHVLIDASTHCEVSGSYFHHSFIYNGSGTRGYGVCLRQHAGENLIVNNIFEHLRHSMMVKEGANGNVFAYNYSIDPFRSEFPSDAGGDISLHGHYPFSNLFEGNMVQTIYIDDYWGPSGQYNTLYRNRADLYGILVTSATSVDQNFVGNEITNNGLFLGLYLLSAADHFAYGNNIKGSIQPSGTNDLSDDSYYLDLEPYFWRNAGNWPSIGAPNVFESGTTPAKLRYDLGQFTDCQSVKKTGTVSITASAILEGAYDSISSQMRTDLYSANLIPEQQPFTVAPWNYSGTEEVDWDIYPQPVVDWVLLELRDEQDPNKVWHKQALLLAADGTLLNLDGTSNIELSPIYLNTPYLICLRTRNHLAVSSTSSINMEVVNQISFNDISKVDPAMLILVDVNNGVYAIAAGDANSDGKVDDNDLPVYLNESSYLKLYLNSDWSYDNKVTIRDYNLWNNNRNKVSSIFLQSN